MEESTVKIEKLETTQDGKADHEFDPHAFRQIECDLPSWMATILILRAFFGLTLIHTVKYFKRAGLLVGFSLIFIIAGLVCYGINTIFRCQYKLCKRNLVPYMPYSMTMKEAVKLGPKYFRKLANVMPFLVNANIVMLQWWKSIMLIYIITKKFPRVLKGYKVDTDNSEDQFDSFDYEMTRLPTVVILVTIPFVMFSLLQNLTILGYVSLVSLATSIACITFLFYYEFISLPCIGIRYASTDVNGFFTFFAMCLPDLEAVGVTLTIEKYMATPRHMTLRYGIINMCMIPTVLSTLMFGFIGYWSVGDDHDHQLEILPKNTVASFFKLLYLIGVFATYALQIAVPFDIVWHEYAAHYFRQSNYVCLYDLMIRVSITLLSAVTILLFPDYITIIYEIVSSITICSLILIYPPIMQFCILWNEGCKENIRKILRCCLRILFGVAMLFNGIVINLLETTKRLEERS